MAKNKFPKYVWIEVGEQGDLIAHETYLEAATSADGASFGVYEFQGEQQLELRVVVGNIKKPKK